QEFKERLYGAPTCTIGGFHTGYGGPGVKTVLPAEARAKLEFRLVPDQRPDDILAKLRRHLNASGFGHVIVHNVADALLPARTPIDDPAARQVAAIAERYFQAKPIVIPVLPGGCAMEPFVNALVMPT